MEPFESDEFGVVGGYAGGYRPEWLEEEEALDAEHLEGPGWGDDFPEEVFEGFFSEEHEEQDCNLQVPCRECLFEQECWGV